MVITDVVVFNGIKMVHTNFDRLEITVYGPDHIEIEIKDGTGPVRFTARLLHEIADIAEKAGECWRTVILPGERPTYSWNEYYTGSHWSKRKAEADRVHQLIRAHIDPDLPLFTERVDICTVVYFDKNPMDACNIPDKIYNDGFIGWYIIDDDRRYVRCTTTQSEIDKDNPRVEIYLIPTGERILDNKE
jgi:hypothetical protein